MPEPRLRSLCLAGILACTSACAGPREGPATPGDRLQAERLVAVAEQRLRAGKPEEALAKARAAMERNPLDRSARLLAARILVRLGRPDEGRALLLHPPAGAPAELTRACFEAAARITLEDLHQPSLAARMIEKHPALTGKKDAGLLLLLGRAQAAAGREVEARRTLEAALGQGADPRSAAPLLARVLFELGDPAAGAAVMQEHMVPVELTPTEKVLLATLLCAAGNTDRGLELFREVQREPHPPVEAFYDAGVALERLGRRAAAEENFRNALAASPGHVPSAWHLGRILVTSGRREEGLAMLEKAVTLEKDPLVKQALRASRDLLAGSGDSSGEREAGGDRPGA